MEKLKARLKHNGKKVNVRYIDNGLYGDLETGCIYSEDSINLVKRRHMLQIGFHLFRFGSFLFVREYFKYNVLVLFPSLSISYVNGNDYYFDIELKMLCFGIGLRFIWLKKK